MLQLSEQVEVAKQQLVQEQELRSVTEEALMEDRVAWQHVHSIATDSHTRFQQIKEILHNVRCVKISDIIIKVIF